MSSVFPNPWAGMMQAMDEAEEEKKEVGFRIPKTEDEFMEFLNGIKDEDQKFLYNILHAMGHRVEGHYVAAWRKRKRNGSSD